MVEALDLLKRERRYHEDKLNAINIAIDALEGSGSPTKGTKRHLTAKGRAALSAAAKRMWKARRAAAKKKAQ